MRKFYSLLILLALSLSIWAWDSPVTIPNVGNARIRIVGQNAANYITNFAASNSPCEDQAEFNTKTYKMANAFLAMQADIIAICEVEENDEILGYICNALNDLCGQNVYTFVTDDLYEHAEAGQYQSLKSGFIYRSDKVTPYGDNTSPYWTGEYNHRLRIQAFTENSTNERFILSMNHFKAKSGYDNGESTRVQNANNLISALSNISHDPDILIMGDLNAYMGEQPIINLQDAGYEEQLVRFDASAYTYFYQGEYGILDHAMANSPMASQITGAYAYHINTAGGYNYKYSDHDAVLVGLNLGSSQDTVPPVECPTFAYDFREGLNDWTTYDVAGNSVWATNANYGVTLNAYYGNDNQEHWLISPALDMSAVSAATLTINHNIYFDNGTTEDYWNDQTVWVSTDYTDGAAPSSATWQQMPLSDYAVKSWIDATATIPSEYLNSNTHIAFKYQCALHGDANYWEIRTASIATECKQTAEVLNTATRALPAARKFMINGTIYIELNGTIYDLFGNHLTDY